MSTVLFFALAGFLGPVMLTLFIRKFPLKKGLGLGFLILLVAFAISGGSVQLLLALIPFAADRLLRSEKSPYFLSTLILPLAWVSVESIFSLLLADQGSIAYSQFENLPLLQLASVTGIAGITFIIAWTASFVSWLYENGFRYKVCRFGIYIFVFVFGAVLEFGLYRLSVHPPAGDLIPVAAVTSNRETKITQAELLTKTAEAADTGARIILWSEGLGTELTGVKELAQEIGVFIFAAVDLKVVLFDPAGEERFSYNKGERRFQFKDTLAGRFGTAIGTDMGFSHFIRAAGQNGVDLIFVPAAESPDVARAQTAVGIFRAVENGFNLVKATSHGKSLVLDYTGRILAQTDRPSEETLIASVPNRGTATPYSQGGWLFGYLCLIFFLGGIARVYFKKFGGPDRG